MEKKHQLFISYRRADSPGHAGRLSDALRLKFGNENVFKDVTSIRGGFDFPSTIKNAIESSFLIVVIIGPHWVGKRFLRPSRIFSSVDWIRKEIETAYYSGKKILPVLVNKGMLPGKAALPNNLKFLPDLNAVQLRDESWDMDLEQLYKELEILSQAPPNPLPVLTSGDQLTGETKKRQNLIGISLVCLFLLAIAFGFFYNKNKSAEISKVDDGKLDVQFIQVNDVREIAPLAGGKTGGIARLATLKKELKKNNPNTFMVMSGNFLSPSLFNSIKFRGQRIGGRQMIETMNVADFDLATFGRHEFDLRFDDLKERINESQFQWISSNITCKGDARTFPLKKNDSNIPRSYIINASDSDGTKAKIGVIAITTAPYDLSYINFSEPLTNAKSLYDSLKNSCDAVIAITNETIANDSLLAKAVPGLSLILGGMEIDTGIKKVGKVVMLRSAPEASSVYITNLKIDKKSKRVTVEHSLQKIDERLKPDYVTNLVVEKWTSIISLSLQIAKFGISESEIVYNKEPLDARDAAVRSRPTNFVDILLASIKDKRPRNDVILFNAGSIRADAILDTPLTVYDIFRSLPFGGGIAEVEMTGDLLIKVLDQGRKNIGLGGFIHFNNEVKYSATENLWTLNNKPIELKIKYNVAMTDFLFTGAESNLSFLKPGNPGIKKVINSTQNNETDIRMIMIDYLKKQKKGI